MSRKMGNPKRGFTLMEVLVAVSIAVFTLAVIISLYLASQQSFTMGTTFLEVHGGARVAMDWMVKDIRWATQASTPAIDELSLEIPSIDGSGDIIDIDNTFDYITYQLNATDPTRLERTVNADALSSRVDETRIIANNVSSITFNSSGSNIAIALTTSRTVLGGRTLQETLNSTVELRNRE
jgi:prepilin-type N-terminal cleavage/methylation domain-containing protein